MPPAPAPCQILIFPTQRVRFGVRQHLNTVRRLVQEANADLSWAPGESQVTPELICDLIPPLADLFEASDDLIADIAIQVSILCIHAIQGGEWDAEELLEDFFKMQSAARNLEAAYAERLSA